jgi:hypothetical protein
MISTAYKSPTATTSLAEALRAATVKYQDVIAQPHSGRAKAYAQRALQALQQFQEFRITSNQ